MTLRPGIKDVAWMAVGAGLLSAVVLAVLYFHADQNQDAQRAVKVQRAQVVEQMRTALASASEAEKSAVLALTDQDSLTFADQARAATAEVERGRRELDDSLKIGGTSGERDALARFATVFEQFQNVDHELLDLAVKNTNLKAWALTFGDAAGALNDMDAALSRLIARIGARADSSQAMLPAAASQAAAWRIQALLAPHIAADSDARMDELEALITKQDEQIRKDLAALGALPELQEDHDLLTALASYKRFSEVRSKILALSRENTNVRSASISLDQKRKVMLLCQNALSDLQRAVQDEPIAPPGKGPSLVR
jgi:hypothetical protein